MPSLCQSLGPGKRTFIAFTYAAVTVKSVGTLASIISLMNGRDASVGVNQLEIGLGSLGAFEVSSIIWKASVLVRMAWGTMEDENLEDACLVLTGFDVPLFNLVASFTMPGFAEARSFKMLHLLHIGGAALIVPTAHAMVQFMVSTPVFM